MFSVCKTQFRPQFRPMRSYKRKNVFSSFDWAVLNGMERSPRNHLISHSNEGTRNYVCIEIRLEITIELCGCCLCTGLCSRGERENVIIWPAKLLNGMWNIEMPFCLFRSLENVGIPRIDQLTPISSCPPSNSPKDRCTVKYRSAKCQPHSA